MQVKGQSAKFARLGGVGEAHEGPCPRAWWWSRSDFSGPKTATGPGAGGGRAALGAGGPAGIPAAPLRRFPLSGLESTSFCHFAGTPFVCQMTISHLVSTLLSPGPRLCAGSHPYNQHVRSCLEDPAQIRGDTAVPGR